MNQNKLHSQRSAGEEIEALLQRDLEELLRLADFYNQRSRPDKATELYQHVNSVRQKLNKKQGESDSSDKNRAC